MHDVGVQQRDRAGAGAQQAAAVLEFLDASLDEAEGVGLVRVPPVAVRDEARAQQVDALDRRVPPVPGNFRRHKLMPTANAPGDPLGTGPTAVTSQIAAVGQVGSVRPVCRQVGSDVCSVASPSTAAPAVA